MLDLRPVDLTPRIVPALGREISPLRDIRSLAQVTAILRTRRPHVVHTHMAKAGFVGRLAARLVGTPVIVHTFHGNVLRGYFGAARSRAFVTLERVMGALSTKVIAISPGQREEILALRIARAENIVVVPLGVDLAPFRDPPRGRLRTSLGIGPGVALVGTVARLVPIKEVELFLRAVAEVSRTRTDVLAVVVGDGPLRADLEAVAVRLGIDRRVHFLGWRADLPAIYADLDVFVLSSRNEGTPVAILEALTAGVPVVATSVGGVPDVVRHGETGLLVRSGDAEALARAMRELIHDPARGRMLAQMGRDLVFPAYDKRMLLGRIDDLYTSLTVAAFDARA